MGDNINNHFSGLPLASCPFMSITHQYLVPEVWDADTIVRNLACDTCHSETYNHWHVCVRKGAAINLHPEYLSRSRQCWFVAMLPIKYLIVPTDYTGPVFEFNGLHTPLLQQYTSLNTAVPRTKQPLLLSYGMTHNIFRHFDFSIFYFSSEH